MVPKHPSWTVLPVLCFAVGCRQHAPKAGAPANLTPQQLLDQVMLPEDQMTPALLESDRVNLVFANLEMTFAQRHNLTRSAASPSGPLTADQAGEHLQTANLLLKVDQDRYQLQQDIMNLRAFTVPRTLRAAQANQ